MQIGQAPRVTRDGLIRLEDGVVQVKDENGDWLPVAVSSAHFIYQLKVDKLKHFEVHIGGAANPVTPRADE